MFPLINKRETGVNLRRIMDMRGITPKDVQEYLGLGCVQSVYRWTDGANMPTIDNLYALSELLQVPIDAITTSYGTFTVAGAIALRSRLRGAGAYGGDADFEGRLQKKLASEYNERVQFCDRKNSQLQSTAEEMRLSILGKDSKTKDEKPLGVVEAYVKENTTELVDPLDVKKKVEALEEKRNALLTELDTQIKVSNATTFIEVA